MKKTIQTDTSDIKLDSIFLSRIISQSEVIVFFHLILNTEVKTDKSKREERERERETKEEREKKNVAGMNIY